MYLDYSSAGLTCCGGCDGCGGSIPSVTGSDVLLDSSVVKSIILGQLYCLTVSLAKVLEYKFNSVPDIEALSASL